ncbi:MAG: hypothetical protein EGR82_10395 [Ruminococcus bicirculans]|nr:hypothetical protein [Ruminococcus bicirculans (ex Wegman et al. 2014)]
MSGCSFSKGNSVNISDITASRKSDNALDDGVQSANEAKLSSDIALPTKDDSKIVLVTTEDKANISDEVIEKVNDKLKEHGINKELVIYGYDFEDYSDVISTLYAGEYQVDIVFTGFGDENNESGTYKAFIDNEMLVPINDYLKNDYGKSLSEIYSRAYFDSVKVDGNIYGLSSKDITGYGISAVFNKNICEKYGIDPDDFNGDWNWLAQQCEKVSDEDIDLIDFQIDCNGMKQLAGFEYDPEFFSVGMGVKEGSSDNKAVNIYSESTQFLQNMKALHDSGYIVSVPTGNDYFVKFVNTDCNALGIMQGDNYTNDGSEEYEITMCEPYAYKKLNAVSGVSSKSNNPEEAFDILALINSDSEIADLIEYGIEGIDYNLDNGRAEIEDGIPSIFTLTNKMITLPSWEEPNNKFEIYKEYNDNINIPSTITYRIDVDGLGELKQAELKCQNLWYGEDVDKNILEQLKTKIDNILSKLEL